MISILGEKMILKRCETKGAYETIPDKIIKLDINKIAKVFNATSVLPMLVMLNIDKHIVTCYKTGKLLIRDCATELEAEEIAKKIYGVK